MTLQELTQKVLEDLPPEDHFNEADAACFAEHRELMANWGAELVQRFYDSLYGHGKTAQVFGDGERSAREQTLVDWYTRTLQGPFDLDYWEWQALVGVLHLRRGVSNPMMLGHWGLVLNFMNEKVREDLSEAQAQRLLEAWQRLGATVGALIAESYNSYYLKALEHSAGATRELLERLVRQEVDDLVNDAREQRLLRGQ